MIPKSGNRFSDKIMHQVLMPNRYQIEQRSP